MRKEVGQDCLILKHRVRREIRQYRGSKHQFSQAACITLRDLALFRSGSPES